MNTVAGKYVPGNSIIHKLDPRIKLGINVILIVLVFMVKSFVMQATLALPVILAYLTSGLKKKKIITIIFPVLFIGIFIFAINLFVLKEDRDDLVVYGKWWKFVLSDLAVYRTLLIMIRIYVMILATTILTATTRPTALTRSIEDLLIPLKLLFVPVHIIAMIISIALRFIPTLLEEAQRIMKAQASRGVDFKNGNIKSKTKATITLIVPLFVTAFAKAEDLGNAMETRGYDPYEKRTRYRAYPIKVLDVAIALFVIGQIVAVALNIHHVFEVPTWIDK